LDTLADLQNDEPPEIISSSVESEFWFA
jgi:hypothetical protein